MKPKILLIDNYDSFTYNLAHYLEQANAIVEVYNNDAPELITNAERYDGIVISPGPSNPSNSGFSAKVVEECYQKKAVLGVCLGMQIINEIFGGKTIKSSYPVHGKISIVNSICESELFKDVPKTFNAARYHSLICADIKDPLHTTAMHDAIPMALQHKSFPLFGVQFHPESFLTEHGHQIIENFVRIIS